MQDRIWEILEHQGRNKKWLARVTGYSHGYVRLVACGVKPASAEFRRRCASVLDVPESVLFVPRTTTVAAKIATVA